MSFKTLLVHVEPTSESDLRLGMAVALAQELGASLAGVGGGVPAYVDNPMLCSTGGMVTQSLADIDTADLKEAEVRFRRLTAILGPAAVWASNLDYPDHALQVCAAGADLIIASAERGPKISSAAVADLVMQAGIPVLSIPVDLPAIRTKRILVAWKNGREARRAVSDSLPLLKRADEVFVVSVSAAGETGTDRASVEAVLDRLGRHHVKATAIDTLEAPNGDVAESLTRFAEDHLIDLLVAGAYGRPRAMEWALGGVTHALLARSLLPVLFSH